MDIKLYYIGQDVNLEHMLSRSAQAYKLDFKAIDKDQISLLPPHQNLIAVIDNELSTKDHELLLKLYTSDKNMVILAAPDETKSIVNISSATLESFNDILTKSSNQTFLDKTVSFYADFLTHKLASKQKNLHELIKKNRTYSHQIANLQEQISQIDSERHVQERVLESINSIRQLSHQINCLDMDTIATVCINQIPKLISARFASLYTLDQEKNTLKLLHHNHPYQISREINLSENPTSPMATAIKKKKMLLIKDFGDYKKKTKSGITREFSSNYQTNSCIIAPLLSGNKILGILNLADKIDAEVFDTKRDLPPVELLCEIIGSAMFNIGLYSQVERKAQTDSMTNLLNHSTFYNVLTREVNRARRYSNSLSLIMIDLDNLKLINDNYGHRAGDAVLIHVSQKILNCIRETDMAARYGGDEFAIILPNTSLADAVNVSKRLSLTVSSEKVKFDNQQLKATVSVGLGQFQKKQSIEEFMNDTDSALFNAKAAGKNRVQVAK